MGSNWHYQVMRHKGDNEEWYGVHEYYTFSDDKAGWTAPAVLKADSVEELKQILKMIEQDIYRHGVKDYD